MSRPDAPPSSPPPVQPILLERRTMLYTLGGLFGAVAVGCGGGSDKTVAGADAGADSAPEPALGPFEAWQQARDAVRTSPDHLAAEADRVVATRDPDAIFSFVRDRIATIPARPHGFGTGAATARRWGQRAVLRAGVGTPRERAELLADLFTKAGFAAEVVVGSIDPAVKDFVARVLFRTFDRTFAPHVTSEQIAAWGKVFGTATPSAGTPLDDHGADSSALAAQLASVPKSPDSGMDLSALGDWPLVKVTLGGSVKYANPAFEGALLGTSYVSGDPASAAAATGFPRVTVTLAAATTADPNKRLTLVTGAFDASDLVGRQVLVQFAPADGLVASALSPVETIHAFVPGLVLRGVGLDPAAATALSYVGGVVTTAGDVATVDASGNVSWNGDAPLASGPPDPAKIASVTALSAEVDASAFPTIRLRVGARNAAGDVVAGLTAGAFRVREDGALRAASLHRNTAPPARVLFILDASSSIPADFLGEPGATLARDMAKAIQGLAPDTVFNVASPYDFAGLVVPTDGWTADPEQVHLRAQKAYGAGLGSQLWSALATASDLGSTAVVFVTDGVADPPAPTQKEVATIDKGPPALMLGVGSVDPVLLGKLASASHGKAVPVSAPAAAVDAVVGFVKARAGAPYELQYTAPLAGAAERAVRVELAGSAVAAATSYKVPDLATRVPTPRLAGLYLTVAYDDDIGNVHSEVTRTLAGDGSYPTSAPVPDATLDAVRDALFGTHMIAFEGAAPTFSAWLDDWLTAKLSLRPVYDALAKRDAGAVIAALGSGLLDAPATAFGLAPPLDTAGSADSITFEQSMRAMLLSHQPTSTGSRRRADYLPLAVFTSAARSNKGFDCFAATLSRTARLAIAEQTYFQTSTASLLAGQPLLVVPAFTAPPASFFASLSAADQAAWQRALAPYDGYNKVLPSGGGPIAFYAIDRISGTLLGVLDDGSGGGRDDLTQLLDRSQNFLDWASALGGLAGATVGFGVFVALQKTIAKLVIQSAIAIATLGTSDTAVPPDLVTSALSAGCNAFLSRSDALIGAHLPVYTSASNVVAIYNALIGSTHPGASGIPTFGSACP